MIESEIYKLSAADYMRVLFPAYLSGRWFFFAIAVVPFIALSFWDVCFVYVALMVVFLLCPMLLALAYLRYAFSDECVACIRRCRVQVMEHSGLKFLYMDDDGNPCGTNFFSFEEFRLVETGPRYIVLAKDKCRFRFLLLPVAQFPAFDIADYCRYDDAATCYGK